MKRKYLVIEKTYLALANNTIRLKAVNNLGSRNNTANPSSFPPQKVSITKKTDEWKQQCIDSIIGKSTQSAANGRNSAHKKQINYDLVNSIFNEADLEYVLDPYGVNSRFNLNSQLQDFNLIRPKLERLKGEELSRPFNFSAVGVGGESIKVRDEYKQKMFLEAFEQSLQLELQQYGMGEPETDEEGNPTPPKTPKQIEQYINYSFRDVREKYANDIIQFLVKYRKLPSLFNKGWEHALISSEEIYYTGIHGGHPIARAVNPINFDFDRTPDMEDIQDAQWCKEDRWLSIGNILDEYREFLADEDIDRMEDGTLGQSFPSNTLIPGFAYSTTDLGSSNNDNNYYYNYSNSGNTQHVRVITVCWKSMRKIGFLTYMDENGEEQTQMIDEEGFKLPDELKGNAKIEWQWINEVYKGTKIGHDIYVDIGPLPNQIKNPENPSECKLPYVGKIYNSLNSKATSIVDLLKPHQYTYIVIWDRLLMELAKSKGRVMLTDIAQLPKSEGFDIEKYMYYVDKGFAFINSVEEGTDGDRTSRSTFNQFQSIDLTASQTIATYTQILDKLEEMAGELIGVSKQRTGDIKASENVSNVNTGIAQSSLVTEYWFYKHNEVKEAVLTRLVELAKLCYHKGLKTQYFIDEGYSAFLDVDGELFNDSEYGVFITNSSKENQIKEQLKGWAQAALQNDKLKFTDVIKIIKSDSIAEITHKIEDSENQRQQQLEQQQEADRQNQRDINDSNIQAQKDQREWDAEQKQLDRENQIAIAELKGLSFAKDTDINSNGIPDIIEQGKLSLEQSRFAYESSLKEKELVQKSQADLLKANTEKYKADISLRVAKENKQKYDKPKPKKK